MRIISVDIKLINLPLTRSKSSIVYLNPQKMCSGIENSVFECVELK